MSKFCVYCGKELEEGATCDCPQSQAAAQTATTQAVAQAAPAQAPTQPVSVAPNPAVQAIGGAFKSLLTILNKPLETMTAYVKKENFIAAIILIVAQAIVGGFFSLAVAGEMVDGVKSFFMTFGFSLLLTVVMYGALFLFALIFKAKPDALNMLCVVSVRSAIIIPFVLIGLLLGLANMGIGLGLFFIGEIFAFVYVVLALKEATKLQDHIAMFVVAFASVVVVIVYAIIMKNVAESLIMDALQDALGGFGSMLGDLY